MRGVEGGYRVVLLVIVGFIVYGSLYPFELRAGELRMGAGIGTLVRGWRVWDGRGDLISNVLLYLPLGFLAVGAMTDRVAAWRRFVAAVLGGVALSFAMEIVQLDIVGRDASMGDVYANAIGTALGAVAGVIVLTGMRGNPILALRRQPALAVLLAAWLGYRLYPYVPVIDLHKYLFALRPVLSGQRVALYDVGRFVILWYAVGDLIAGLYGARRSLRVLLLVVGIAWVGQVLILDRALNPEDLYGGAIAMVLHAVAGRRTLLLAPLFAALVLAERLRPFAFVAEAQSFGWVPLRSMMTGSIGVAIQAFCEKVFLYGTMLWLLARAGLGLAGGTAMGVVLLVASSVAQTHLPGRSAEIGDAALVLAIGLMIACLGGVRKD